MASPSDIFKVKFLEPSNPKWVIGDCDYLDYMSRPEKFEKLTPDEKQNDFLDYMRNPEKSMGVFDAEKDLYTEDDKNIFRQHEYLSKQEGCPKYIGVLSFDNKFLEDNGLLIEGNLDVARLRSVARAGITELVHTSQKLDDDNVYWAAAIHLNTDNIHIHYAFLEHEKRVDRRLKYKDGNCIEQTAINALKSKVFNDISRYNEEKNSRLNELHKLQRELLLPKLEKAFAPYTTKISTLVRKLPPKKLWQYNRSYMAPYRAQIDECIKDILQSSPELSEAWNKYNSELSAMSLYYKSVYGSNKDSLYLNYKENQLKEFYERAGNKLLGFMRNADFDTLKQADAHLSEESEVQIVQIEQTDNVGQEADVVQYVYDASDDIDAYLSDNEYDKPGNTTTAHLPHFEKAEAYLSEGKDTKTNDEGYMQSVHSEDIEAYLSEYKITPYLDWNDSYKSALTFVYGNKHTEPNREEAVKLLTSEANQGNVLAMNTLGKIYSSSTDEAELELSERYYKMALAGYNAIIPTSSWERQYINYLAGKAYYYGLGTKKDTNAAFQHYMNAGEYPAAQFALGNMYRNGEGTTKNLQMAFDCYQKALSPKMPYAYYMLARCCEQGEGTNVDLQAAAQYYAKAYSLLEKSLDDRKKDDNLLYRLGSMLYAGKGVDVNVDKAKTMLSQSAELGNNNAIMLLAKIALEENDVQRAIEMYSILADSKGNNNPAAQYALGKIFLTEGEQYSVEKAAVFLEKSAVQGNEYAQYTLGKLLLSSDRKEDVNQAFEWLHQAADEHNNIFAQYALGQAYLKIDKYDEAKMYLECALKQGHIYAADAIEYLRTKRTAGRRSKSIANAQLIKSAAADMYKAKRCAEQTYFEMMTHLQQLMREFELNNNISYSI